MHDVRTHRQEDTYTQALSTIITRDFFPNLPHIHATNDYLSALTNNDPELLSSSIRRLAALAKAKDGGEDDARQREFENAGTPYMNVPGGRAQRTPVGARGWDTPVDNRRDPLVESEAGPSRPAKRQRLVRDDLPLDAFQANYTSEDNASFVEIVNQENQQRQEERWGWAWEAEKKAEQRRLAGEEKRKMILDTATQGRWRVNGEGKRLIGGLAEGGSVKPEGEAWNQVKLIESQAESSALVLAETRSAMARPESKVIEQEIPEDHPLHHALAAAGLPSTALVLREDGAIVPHREIASGQGDGRQRDDNEQQLLEQAAMGDQEQDVLSLGGSGVDQWGFKVRWKGEFH